MRISLKPDTPYVQKSSQTKKGQFDLRHLDHDGNIYIKDKKSVARVFMVPEELEKWERHLRENPPPSYSDVVIAIG